jgi:hypothetical protein
LPRISTVVEPPVFKALERLAKRDGVSLSQKTRDLLLEALELFEDSAWESIAQGRMKNKSASIAHKDFWRSRGIK